MDYKEKQEQEKIVRELKRSVYTEIINDLIGEKSFEEIEPVKKLQIHGVIMNHGRLPNRYES